MSDVVPTEEAVKALLDYLVDPLLPVTLRGKDPPSLDQQQSVAKQAPLIKRGCCTSIVQSPKTMRQMHAVVLLYNYYHRKQHPELCFLEYESFCKLAVTLKPTLVAHMKSTHQAGSTWSTDLQNQLSVTEKAIMDACNISLSLDTLKDVPSTEGWPISKVSVLLIDSKKENCVLIFDSVTRGVWSVIEKCVDVSNTDSEIASEGKCAKKRKTMGKKTATDEQLSESGFEQLAFGAVKEATGINWSELMVLERHMVYSLSKEKTAAYFYIMQCTSNGDIQVPIKDTIESLQGPLFEWVYGSWTHTSVVEYYNVLPYAMIVSSWYSREVSSNGLQKLNVSSCQEIGENGVEKFSEREQVISNGLQNLSVENGNVKVNSSQMPENPCYQENSKDKVCNDGNCSKAKFISNETSVTEKFYTADDDAQETEQSDESWDIAHPTVQHLESHIAANCCVRDTIVTDKWAEKEVEETETHDILLDINQPAVKKLENYYDIDYIGEDTIGIDNTKRSAKKVEDTGKSVTCEVTYSTVKELGSILANSDDDETIDANNSKGIKKVVEDTEKSDNSKRAVKEVEETEKHEILLDINQPAVKKLENCVDIDYIDEETIGIDNIKRLESKVEDTEKSKASVIYSTDQEFRNSIIANSSEEETIDADYSKGIKKVVEDTERSDQSCIAINSTTEASKRGPTNEFQMCSLPCIKRQKMDKDGVIMNNDKNEDNNKNADVPMRVYHHQQRKTPIESDACATVGGAINVEADGAPKSKASIERKVSGNCICWTIPSNPNGTQVADSVSVWLEPNARSAETLKAILATKDTAMTQAALGFLFRKRAKLCQQKRHIQDEIALCGRNIQKILEGFNDKTQDDSCQHGEGHHLNQCTMGKRISDTIFNLGSPSQDLDDICRENNWIAKYSVSEPDGGFVAKITVKGMDFDCSCLSELLSTPEEARDSAAARMIAHLRSVAGHTT